MGSVLGARTECRCLWRSPPRICGVPSIPPRLWRSSSSLTSLPPQRRRPAWLPPGARRAPVHPRLKFDHWKYYIIDSIIQEKEIETYFWIEIFYSTNQIIVYTSCSHAIYNTQFKYMSFENWVRGHCVYFFGSLNKTSMYVCTQCWSMCSFDILQRNKFPDIIKILSSYYF